MMGPYVSLELDAASPVDIILVDGTQRCPLQRCRYRQGKLNTHLCHPSTLSIDFHSHT